MHILLDESSSKTIGLSVAGRPDIPTAEQEVEYIYVDGRNGSLTKKKNYKDVEFTIPFDFLSKTKAKNVKSILRDVNKWLLDKQKLVFSDDPDFFHRIKNTVVESTVNDIDIHGQVEIRFICYPFQFRKTAELTISAAGNLDNPGSMPAEPLIKVFGTGNGTVTINGQDFKLNGITDYISVDSELGEAHRNGISKNSLMVGEFPIFKPGANAISFNAAITKLVIEPRWCDL